MCSRFFLCVVLWAVSAVLAVADTEITSDYIIDASNVPPLENNIIRVRGDAVLTIQNSPDGTVPKAVGKIALYDNASLVVHSGELRGNIGVFGNNRLEFRGGNFYHDVTGTGDAHFLVDGMEWGSSVQFTGGVQHYEIRSVFGAGAFGSASIHVGREDSIEVFTSNPEFRYGIGSEDAYFLGTYPRNGVNNTFKVLPDFSDSPDPTLLNFVIRDSSGRPDGDADLDGDVDLQDLNIIRNAFGSPHVSRSYYFSEFDVGAPWAPYGDTLPFDGRVDLDDINRVRNNFGESMDIPPSPPNLFGDADRDGDVDHHDLIAVREGFDSFGVAGGGLLGDTWPFDGHVDLDDLNNVRNHLVVPEPGSLWLITLTAACVAVFRAIIVRLRNHTAPRQGLSG